MGHQQPNLTFTWEIGSAINPTAPLTTQALHPPPGNTTSEQRYIRGKYMLEALNDPTSHLNGIIKINSALPIVPIGMVGQIIDGQPITSATQYTATYNLSEQVLFIRYQYEDVFTQYHLDFKSLNDGRNYILDATCQSCRRRDRRLC